MQRLGYQPALDGFRGVAIGAVVSFHAFGYPRDGFLGVDLFFVLSGFLITTLLLEEHQAHDKVSLLGFYRRRALRLLPALFGVLAAVLAVAVARSLGGNGGLVRTVVGAAAGVGYVSNLLMANSPASLPTALSHLWSLATEEQFYLLWPPVLVLVLRMRRLPALSVLALVLGLSVFRQVELLANGAPGHRLDFAPDTRGASIVIGCIFAMACARLNQRLRFPRLAPAAVATVAVMTALDLGRMLYIGPLVLFGFAAGVIIVRALDPASQERRVLSFGPLVLLGRLSYSLYLWHVPVFVALGVIGPGVGGQAVPGEGGFVRQIAALALSIAAAGLSFHFIEQPFLRRKRRVRRTRAPAPPLLQPAPAATN